MDGKLSPLPDVRKAQIVGGERYQFEGQELIAAEIAQGTTDYCQGCELRGKPACIIVFCRNFVFLTPANYLTHRLLK